MTENEDQMRLDKLIVETGAAASRDRAIDLIKRGAVLVNDRVTVKPGKKVGPDDRITLEEQDPLWVSRGALKLKEALDAWNIDTKAGVCVDVGAAAGGFTEVLLHRGAQRVYAVDVGRNQLAESLRQNPKVVNMEKTNFRRMRRNKIKEKVDLVCMDVSYISLTLVLERAKELLKGKGVIIALIKPQFEMENKKGVGKGIIKSAEKRERAINKIRNHAREIGLEDKGLIDSPVLGAKGNQEFLILLTKSPRH